MVTKFFPTIVTSTCNRTVEMENVHVTETAAAACRLVVALIRREGKGKENQLLLAQREREMEWSTCFVFKLVANRDKLRRKRGRWVPRKAKGRSLSHSARLAAASSSVRPCPRGGGDKTSMLAWTQSKASSNGAPKCLSSYVVGELFGKWTLQRFLHSFPTYGRDNFPPIWRRLHLSIL